LALSEKIIIVPYRKTRAGLTPGEIRQATNAASAQRIASSMSGRFIGVGAYAVMVDTETGDMTSPRVLASFGEVPDASSLLDGA
jgi:hypothetical protein